MSYASSAHWVLNRLKPTCTLQYANTVLGSWTALSSAINEPSYKVKFHQYFLPLWITILQPLLWEKKWGLWSHATRRMQSSSSYFQIHGGFWNSTQLTWYLVKSSSVVKQSNQMLSPGSLTTTTIFHCPFHSASISRRSTFKASNHSFTVF